MIFEFWIYLGFGVLDFEFEEKKMEKRQIILFGSIGAAVLILLLVVFGILPGFKPSAPTPAALEMWGVADSGDVWQGVLEPLREALPHISVNYTQFPEEAYETILINRLAAGTGPDIFYLKNSWILKHGDKIFPLPPGTQFSVRDFQQTFVDVASADLITEEGVILGLPLYVDTLALFYNKDLFNAAGIAQAPKDWDEILAVTQKLSRANPVGAISQSGIALGTGRNVRHALEILSALMMQNGESIVDRRSRAVVLQDPARDALDFYTSFANPRRANYSWNSLMPNSLDAFAEGKTAMMLGFASDIAKIRAKNPRLNFDVVSLPQPKGSAIPLTYGSYYFPAVSKLSPNRAAAWQFLFFITSRDMSQLYLEKTGRPPARRDLVARPAPSAELEPFWKQTLVAKSWLIPDEPRVRTLFEDVIESIVSGRSSLSEGFSRLRGQVELLMPRR